MKWLFAAMSAALFACAPANEARVVAPLRSGPPALAPEESFRAQQPESSLVVPSPSLAWQTAQLDNGMRLLVLERHDLPIVSVRLAIDHGASDAAATPEAFSMLQRAMLRGTESRAPEATDTAYRRLGAMYGNAFSQDACILHAKAAARDLEPVLALLADTAMHPRLASPTFERLRDDWLAQLSNLRHDLRPIERDILTLLGANGTTTLTVFSPERLRGLRAESIAALHAKLFRPEQATLIVVGDTSMASVTAMAARSFGDWQSHAAPLAHVSATSELLSPSRGVLLERNRDLGVNTFLLARGPAPSSEDAAAFEVLAHCLGDPWSSLHETLREQNGANYAIGADVIWMHDTSTLVMSVPLEASKALPMLETTFDVIEQVKTQGPRAGDFEGGRAQLLARWRTTLSNNDGLANAAARAITVGAGIDTLAQRPLRAAAVTPDDVRRVANRYLGRASLRLMVVGPREFLAPMKRLTAGSVEFVSQ